MGLILPRLGLEPAHPEYSPSPCSFLEPDGGSQIATRQPREPCLLLACPDLAFGVQYGCQEIGSSCNCLQYRSHRLG